MIERPDLTARAQRVIAATADAAQRSATLDALGRFQGAPTADHYDALRDVLTNFGKPPMAGTLAAARDLRIGAV